MGILLPPDELVVALSEQWPGREPQIRQLTTLLSVSFPIPACRFDSVPLLRFTRALI
jgi:hypothetical protein